MRRHFSCLGILVLVFVISPSSWGQASGTLAVQVAAPGGGSPSGLVVVASLSVPDTAAGYSGPRAFASVTSATGQVSFTGLPFGVYSVCAEPHNQIFVEPCLWSPPDTVHLTSQNTSGTVNLTVQLGIPIEIRIDDPAGLLSSSSTRQPLQVGVVTPVGPMQLRPIAQDSGGINYRFMAPASVAGSVRVSAGTLQVVGATGTPVNFSGPAAAFNLSPTATGQAFRFAVWGSH
jgi:hypothetical protein